MIYCLSSIKVIICNTNLYQEIEALDAKASDVCSRLSVLSFCTAFFSHCYYYYQCQTADHCITRFKPHLL